MENKKIDDQLKQKDYEISLYGFSIDEFTKDNPRFVANTIKTALEKMNLVFFDLIKDIKPEAKQRIAETTKTIAKNIIDSSKESLEKHVNSYVKEKFAIPNNVILHNDRVQLIQRSKDDLKKLEEGVDVLSKVVMENSIFLNQLKNEMSSYDVNELLNQECTAMKKAEEYLNSTPLEVDILLNSARKIQPN